MTAGVGWGRFASVGGGENPFCAIADSFCTREIEFGKGGKPTFKAMFHGETWDISAASSGGRRSTS